MAFHEVRFPVDISYGSSGGPNYSTDVVVMASGHEQRNINWSQARATYNVAHGVKTQTQLDALIAFFRARKGRAFGFRFKDWMDFEATGQQLAIGDGTRTHFELVKHYSSGEGSESRRISKPVASTVRLFVDGSQQDTGWVLDDTIGQVQFATPPANGAIISADFAFDVPVRFDTDQLSARLDDYGVRSWNNIDLVELRI